MKHPEALAAFRDWTAHLDAVESAALQIVAVFLVLAVGWGVAYILDSRKAAADRRKEAEALARLANKAQQPKKGWM